jgi:hypothetical protein
MCSLPVLTVETHAKGKRRTRRTCPDAVGVMTTWQSASSPVTKLYDDTTNRKESTVNNLTTMTNRSKALLTIAGLLLALVAATAAPASADAPVITRQVINIPSPVPFGVTCATFNVLATLRLERTDITFSENGIPVRNIRHVHSEGTLYNPTTGYSVPFDGAFTRTEDSVAQTATYSGRHVRVLIPGQGVLALDVGERIMDVSVSPPELIFQGGQHEYQAQVCQILNQ